MFLTKGVARLKGAITWHAICGLSDERNSRMGGRVMFELHENSSLEPQIMEFELELGDTLLNWKVEDFEDILPERGNGEDFQWEEVGNDDFIIEYDR